MSVLTVFTDREPAEKRWVALAYLLITLTMVCGIVSFWLYTRSEAGQLADRTAERATDLATSLRDAQETSCISFNQEQEGDRASVLNNALVLFGLAEPGELDEAARTEIVATLDDTAQERYGRIQVQAAIDNPYRDCSPAGLDEFYNTQEDDPATPITDVN